MEIPEHIEQLRADGERLATIASSVDLASPVPTCPDWEVRDLIQHVGGVHRWATGFVSGAQRQPQDDDLEQVVGGWPPDGELIGWFRAGHRGLVEALRSAPSDLETWTFLEAPSPLAFWARRQAHETAIHRVDAESAAADVTGFPSGFAADGIDELLFRFMNRPGRTLPVEAPRSMLLRTPDAQRSWRVRFTPTGFETQADQDGVDDDADLIVVGTASDLYVALWNRSGTAGLDLSGDSDVFDLWNETARIRWT